jgi:acyl dehydratase
MWSRTATSCISASRIETHPVHEGDVVTYSMETVSNRETSKPKWGLIGNTFRVVNQRGEEVMVFSSVVLVARRPKDL